MGSYQCVKCKQNVLYPSPKDDWFYARLRKHCSNCYTIIASGNYEKNIPGAKTIFAPFGECLGDKVMSLVIVRKYKADNPDENIIAFWQMDEFKKVLKGGKFDKAFYSNQSGIKPEIKKENVYWFNVLAEVDSLAEQGVYPEWALIKTSLPDEIVRLFKYPVIAMHIRNIQKCEEKNMELEHFYQIMKAIDNSDFNYNVIIVGNDRQDKGFALSDFDPVFVSVICDCRNQLTLNEISLILRACYLFIGKDSGIAHLAAASSCADILTWGYKNERWFPKTPNILNAFCEKDSSVENIVNKLKDIL